MPGSGASFLCCLGWDGLTLLCRVSSLWCLSSCPNCMISEARTYISVHKRYLEIEWDMMGYFSWKLLTLNGYRYLSLQMNTWTTQLKACRECGGSSSRTCQRQRWRKGLENGVISKSSETGGWWWSKWQVGFQEVWGKLRTRQERSLFLYHCLLLLYFECSLQFCLPCPQNGTGLERTQKRAVG